MGSRKGFRDDGLGIEGLKGLGFQIHGLRRRHLGRTGYVMLPCSKACHHLLACCWRFPRRELGVAHTFVGLTVDVAHEACDEQS